MARATDLPLSIATLRHAGPAKLCIQTNTGREVTLELDPFYITQTFGNRLTSVQMEKLSIICVEAPEKFDMLARLFPQHIAEYLIRTNLYAVAAGDAAISDRQWFHESSGTSTDTLAAARSGSGGARTRTSRQASTVPGAPGAGSQPRGDAAAAAVPAGGISSSISARAATLRALQDEYRMPRSVGMSLSGNTLTIGGRVVTDAVRMQAAALRVTPEVFADRCLRAARRALAKHRTERIRAFVSDPRLAGWTPEEIFEAYVGIFGREFVPELRGVLEENEQRGRTTAVNHVLVSQRF